MAEKLKGYSPKNPLLSPRFGDIATFARLPHIQQGQDLKNVDVAVIGVPFDGGATFRPGARFGPRAIRIASCLNRNVSPSLNINIYEHLSVIDYGDINCNPLNIKQTHKIIEKEYKVILKKGITPITMGGDHSILLPILRAYKNTIPRFGLVQFDAHTDTQNQAWGEKLHHGTPVRRLIEEGILKGNDIYQIGIRQTLTSKEQNQWDQKHGITQFTVEQFHSEGINGLLRKLKSNIPYYLSFDIDGVDPAFAPGTGTPVVGGLTSFEAIHFVQKLSKFRFIGFDVVEVAPIYDHAEITTLLASSLIFEFMSILALQAKR